MPVTKNNKPTLLTESETSNIVVDSSNGAILQTVLTEFDTSTLIVDSSSPQLIVLSEYGSPVIGVSSSTFLGLVDAPDTYTGQANKIVSVNSSETGLVFTDSTAGGNVDSVFGRTGVVTAESGDYASFYAPIIHTHTVNDITDLTTYYYDKTTTNSLLSNKANLVTGTVGNFVELDGTGQLRDSLSNYTSFANWQQGILADTALQPGNNISLLTNDSGYITAADIPSGAVSSVFGRIGTVTAELSDYSLFYTQPGENISIFNNDAGYITAADLPPDAGVASFNGRSGVVTSEAGDYSAFYATVAQGALADTALQPNDNISELTNDANYITLAQVPADAVPSVFGRIGAVTAESNDYASYYATVAQGALADTALQSGDNISVLTNDADYITVAESNAAIDQSMINHLNAQDPHPQYLTPDQLPSTFVSWFTNDVNPLNSAYLTLLQTQPSAPSSAVAVTTTATGVPTLLGQWMRANAFSQNLNYYETQSNFQLDFNSTSTNGHWYIETWIQPVSGAPDFLLARSSDVDFVAGRHIYTGIILIPGPIELSARDITYSKIYIVRDSGANFTATLYMEGANLSRFATVLPIPTYPAPHATTHEVGGSDQIAHSQISGAFGYLSHEEIDNELAALQSNKLQAGDNVSELTNDIGYITAADIPTAISTIPANSLIYPQSATFAYCRNMEVIASVDLNNLAIEVYNLINNQWQVVYTDLSTNIAAIPILSTNGRCITVSSGETVHTHRETLTGWTVLPIQNITGLQSIIEVTEVDDYERMLYQTSTGFYTSDLINDVWSNFRFVASGGSTSLAVYGNFLVNWTTSKAAVYQLIGGVWTLHHSYTSGSYGNVTVRFDGSMILHGSPASFAIETPTTITSARSFVQNSGAIRASIDFSKLLIIGNSSIQQFTYDNQSIAINFILDTPILLTSGSIASYSVSFAGDQVITRTPGNDAQIITFNLVQSATPSDAVLTVFGRSGSVVAQSGDYSAYYAPVSKGFLADTALQPNDNISELTNDANYITLAQVPPVDPTNLSTGYNTNYIFLNSSTGADTTITAATSVQAGVMSNTDKITLDSALQSGDNISELTNDSGYITLAQVPVDAVSSVFGRTGVVSAQSGDYATYYAPIEATSYAIDTVQAVSSPSSVNIANGGFLTYTATGANTWNFTVPNTAGKAIGWTLELTNGGTGTQTFTGVTWAAGAEPTLVASGLNVLVFTKNNVTGVIRGYVAV